jgi:hypothetical protein
MSESSLEWRLRSVTNFILNSSDPDITSCVMMESAVDFFRLGSLTILEFAELAYVINGLTRARRLELMDLRLDLIKVSRDYLGAAR